MDEDHHPDGATRSGRGAPQRISMVLPDVKFTTQSGGYRVHYEMANRLAARGHHVVVLHTTKSWRVWLRSWTWRVRRRPLAQGFVEWFRFTAPVELRVVRRVGRRAARHADRLVFTGWTTLAEARPDLPVRELVLAWDYETWAEADDDLRTSMRDAFARPGVSLIAGSVAVQSMLTSMSLEVTAVIPPGIDRSTFARVTPARKRVATVGFLHRTAPRRGIPDALRALDRVRSSMPEVVIAAGASSGDDLPAWIVRCVTTTDDQLAAFYDRLTVFLLPSRAEGLGLPALEAMACGAAVVVTDNGGSRQFAREGENALVVPVGDDEAMAEAVLRLLRDDELRNRLADAGSATAEAFAWDRCVQAFEAVLS